MTTLNGQKPILGHKASAEELTALFANPDRHPNALGYELKRASNETLAALAFGEATDPDLARAAYDETERRDRAIASLLGSNPTLRAAMAARLG